jgi:two-component system, NtrC family, response regulator AtoC
MGNPGAFPSAFGSPETAAVVLDPFATLVHGSTETPADVPLSFADDGIVEPLDGRRAFIAASPAMREVRAQVGQVANTNAAVLLLGESGTGKEVIAHLIHKLSRRSSQKFLKVNCAALPVELLESELFGYEAGAFTGARQAKAGKFEICHRGTIFLDEVGEMPVALQAKLLHVLQDGEFSRLGSVSTVQADARVLAATNVNVREAVQSGKLRTDLYYRLNVFTIHLPPLRERREDLPYLLNYLMAIWAASYGRPRAPITHRILAACASYPWPGNVRELESFVKRYLVLGDEKLAIEQLKQEQKFCSDPGAGWDGSPAGSGCSDLKAMVRSMRSEAERAAIIQALERADGCKQEAAERLGICVRALYYKIRRYQIQPPLERPDPIR